MANPKIQIGDNTRLMTDDELAAHEQYKDEIAATELDRQTKKQTVLDKLGLTADEAVALLG